jgi:hypothetical protein
MRIEIQHVDRPHRQAGVLVVGLNPVVLGAGVEVRQRRDLTDHAEPVRKHLRAVDLDCS